MIREQLYSCGGVVVNVAQASMDGPPMLLLHGVTRRWQDWLMTIPLLAPRWTIFALDFRGHGRSKFTSGYRVVDYATEVIAFLREHSRQPVVIVGHSLGAMVAAVAAAEVPDRVRAIAMVDPPFETLGSRRQETSWMSFFRGLQPFAGSSVPVSVIARELAEVRICGPKTPPVRLGDTRDGAALVRGAVSQADGPWGVRFDPRRKLVERVRSSGDSLEGAVPGAAPARTGVARRHADGRRRR